MKILLAHNNFYCTGGTDVFFFETGRILENNGHTVAYFSTANKNNLESEYTCYFPKYADYQNGHLLSRIIKFPKMVYSFRAKNKLLKLIEDFQPDVAHVFSIHTRLTPSILDTLKKLNIPIVMSCNEYKYICPNNRLFHHNELCEDCDGNKFYMAVKNKCCKNSLIFSIANSFEAYIHYALNIYKNNINTFLFASNYMAKKYEQFWGMNSFNWEILKNPFDGTTFSVSNKNGDYILSFGRLSEEKGLSTLIKAMSKLDYKIPLIIAGDGPEKLKIEKMTKELKLNNIKFMGSTWGKDLNKLIEKCRFVVVPSVWNENYPYSILQSFAFGKTVIGTNRGGIPEMIKHNKRGFICEANNEINLAENIEKLWGDPKLSKIMGLNAKIWADKKFNDTVFYSNLNEIYQRVIN